MGDWEGVERRAGLAANVAALQRGVEDLDRKVDAGLGRADRAHEALGQRITALGDTLSKKIEGVSVDIIEIKLAVAKSQGRDEARDAAEKKESEREDSRANRHWGLLAALIGGVFTLAAGALAYYATMHAPLAAPPIPHHGMLP